MVDVTIAICTFNRSQLLRLTLEHLTHLRVPTGTTWELLVINNNCSDDTEQVCSEFCGRLPIRSVMESKPGLSYARNTAIREAKSAWVAWTDDDVLIGPDWMSALIQAAQRTDADVVFGPSRPHWLGMRPDWYSSLHSGRFAICDYGDQPFVATDPDQSFFGLNFATSTQTLERLGGFDETLGYGPNGGGGGEDVDFYRRCLASGMKVVYVPEAIVEHMIPAVRCTKAFYRERLRSATERDYEQLRVTFLDTPSVAGLPRFMFRQAAADALGYLISALTGARDKTFDRELKLRRFTGYLRAARNHKARPPVVQATS